MWKKVVGPTLLVSVLWITVSSVTTFYIHWVYEHHSRILTENVSTIRSAGAMQESLWRLQAVVLEAAGKEQRETQLEAAELKETFERYLAQAEKSCSTPQEQSLLNGIREHFAVYWNHIQGRMRPQGLTDLIVSQAAEREKTMRLARAVAEPSQQLLELNERLLKESSARSARLTGLVNLVRFAFLIAGPIIGILCGLWVARGLNRSISQISITLTDATGNLDREVGRVEVQNPGDLPGLQQQVRWVVTRLRQVMDELQQARKETTQAARLAAVGELAAGVAHELRNPLTSVKLLIQTAAKRQGDSALQEKPLQVAKREIARMEKTIQGLLDFARPPRLRRVTHDLRGTAQRALNLVAGRAKQQEVLIVQEFSPMPVLVDGDPEQLHQVFINLALNGIEAMPEGGKLQVCVLSDAMASRVCRVVFRDTGPGISAEVMPRLFEPFVTSKSSGTGLGLAISRRIVEEHGGAIHSANGPEGGAVFTVELPVREADGAPASNPGDGESAECGTMQIPAAQDA